MESKKTKLSLRTILQFLIICVGGGSIYTVLYMRGGYYEGFIQAFTITDGEFAIMISAYSITAMLTYFLGGVLADKVSTRKLLTFSFLSTGVMQIYFASFPSYNIALILFACMGVTTTLTFWAALIKATRQLGASLGKESTALGFQEGFRSVWGMIIGTITAAIYASASTLVVGLRISIIIYGSIVLLAGIATWFVFEDGEKETSKDNPFKLAKQCLSYPGVWINALIVMCLYAMSSTVVSYASKLSTEKFGIAAGIAVFVAMIQQYANPIGSIGGGLMGDKLGAAKTLVVGTIGMIIGCLAIVMLPAGAAIPFVIAFFVFVIFMGCVRGQFYAPLRETGVPMHLTGTAIGLIATIGYLPDVFMTLITGYLLDRYDGITAFNTVLITLVGFGVFALIFIGIFIWLMKKKKAEQINA